MATTIWYPERGDSVKFKDGHVGAVTEVCHINANLDAWLVKTRINGLDGPMAEVQYSGILEQWEEVQD